MAARVLSKLRVVFDLDECLVHTTPGRIEKTVFKSVPKTKVHKITSIELMEHIMIERPHLHACLDMIKNSNMAEIFLFTAAPKEYAEEALNLIDPDRKYFTKVWSRNDCEYVCRHDTKDLRTLKEDFIPERTVLIDDRNYNFFLQPENGYLIEHFRPLAPQSSDYSLNINNYEDDNHLLTACEFVTQQLLHAEDVREVLKTKFSHRAVHKKEFNFDLDEHLKEVEAKKRKVETEAK